jgi:2-polyprenyl-3-methyl-5-hydroxy-6-metoxy-1,4-benzoquinol methylase
MYTAFASVYDRLMSDVDYPAWAKFYATLMEQYRLSKGKVCECACGTGSLTILLAQLGYQMTGVDLSADMLFEASQKARKHGAMIPFVKQDMRELRLHRQMDAVLCTNDGLNYLPTGEDVAAFFRAAYLALRPGGGLFFDVSTPYKLEHVLGNTFLGHEEEDVAYLWQNSFSKSKQSVDLDLTIFLKQQDGSYRRIEEHQRQYIHGAEMLNRLLLQTGFAEVAFYGDQKLTGPSPKEQRWHMSARKPFSAQQ